MKHRNVLSTGVLIGLLGSVITTHTQNASANPVAVAAQIASIVKQAYSTTKWLQCALGGTGALCPESEVATEANRVIADVESVVTYADLSTLLGEAWTLSDDAANDYYDISLLTPDMENELVHEAIGTYNDFAAHLEQVNPNNLAESDEAYALLPAFNVVAALTDRILRTAQARGQVSIDPSQLQGMRDRTVATNYAMVGWPQVWVPGAEVTASIEETFDNAFITKGLEKHLFNYTYAWNTWSTCNLSADFAAPPGQICVRNSNSCLWGVCLARTVPSNDVAISDAMGDILNRIHSDPVVQVARTAIQILASSGHDTVHESYPPWTSAKLIPQSIDFSQNAFAFDNGNGPPQYPYSDDWAYGQFKGQCQSGYPAMGMSVDPQTGRPHSIFCDSPLSYPVPFWGDGPETSAQTFASTNSLGYGERGDWDPGFYKGECPSGDFVTGIAQDPSDGTVTSLECSLGHSGDYLIANDTCEVRALPHPGPDTAPDDLPGYDWAPGFNTVQCSAGEVMSGVSTYSPWSDGNLTNHPHAILCCELAETP